MKKYLPKEHGAWLIFFVPALCGIFAVNGGEYSSPSAAFGYIFLILIGFVLTKPLSTFSNPKENFRDYFNGVLLLSLLLLLASCFLIEAGRLKTTLLILSPLFVLFFLAALLVKPSQSSLLKRLSGILFPLSAIGGYYAYHGTVDLNAYLLYMLNVLFFFPRAIFASEYFIEKRRAFWGKGGLINIFSFVILFFLYLSGFINIKIMVLYLLLAVPTFVTLMGGYQWKHIKAYGKTEMYLCFGFMLSLIVLF